MSDIQTDLIARTCYNNLCATQLLLGETVGPPWAKLPDDTKDTMRALVTEACDPKADAESMHTVWLKNREAAGWRYAPEDNHEKRCSRWLIPFADLPLQEISKYRQILMTVAGAKEVAANAQGLEIDVAL